MSKIKELVIRWKWLLLSILLLIGLLVLIINWKNKTIVIFSLVFVISIVDICCFLAYRAVSRWKHKYVKDLKSYESKILKKIVRFDSTGRSILAVFFKLLNIVVLLIMGIMMYLGVISSFLFVTLLINNIYYSLLFLVSALFFIFSFLSLGPIYDHTPIEKRDIIRYVFKFKKPNDTYGEYWEYEILPLLKDIYIGELKDKQQWVSLKYTAVYIENIVLRLNFNDSQLKKLLNPLKEKISKDNYSLTSYLEYLDKNIRQMKSKEYNNQILLLKSIYKNIDNYNVFSLSKSLAHETKVSLGKIFSYLVSMLEAITKYKLIRLNL